MLIQNLNSAYVSDYFSLRWNKSVIYFRINHKSYDIRIEHQDIYHSDLTDLNVHLKNINIEFSSVSFPVFDGILKNHITKIFVRGRDIEHNNISLIRNIDDDIKKKRFYELIDIFIYLSTKVHNDDNYAAGKFH